METMVKVRLFNVITNELFLVKYFIKTKSKKKSKEFSYKIFYTTKFSRDHLMIFKQPNIALSYC